MILKAMRDIAAMGAVALSTDAARDSMRVTALDAAGPDTPATRRIEQHTYYLCAVLGTQERIALIDVLRKIGYSRATPVDLEPPL